MSTEGSSLLGALQDESGESLDGRFFAPVEQLDMLRDRDGRLPKDALRRTRIARGRGRPPGSRNRQNVQLAKWFVGKYGDPLDVLGEVMTMPLDALYEQMVLAQGGEAKNKRITGRDAIELKLRAAMDAAPYIHGKQPLAVNITGRADAVLFIPGLNAPHGFSADQLEHAVDALGISAIELEGIRLADGTLVTADDDGGADGGASE